MPRTSSLSSLEDLDDSLPVKRRRVPRARLALRVASAEPASINQQRNELLSLIRAETNGDTASIDSESQYRQKVKACLRDQSGEHPTILHWILWQADHEIQAQSPSWSLKASQKLVVISLKLDPSIITVQDNRNDTALHAAVALTSKHADVESLAICMCENVPPSTIRKALSVVNYLGETSIHIAVVRQLEIASRLVQIADQATLLLQRNGESNGKSIGGGGNTALHDAVVYERCQSEESSCRENELCPRCADIDEQAWDKRGRVLELLELLIHRAPDALTVTNAADESPYLHHLATKLRQQGPIAQPGRLGYMTDVNKATVKGDTTTRTGTVIFSPDKDPKTQLNTSTSKSGATGHASVERSKGNPGARDSTSMGTKPADATTALSESESCPGPIPSDKIAIEVESYLLESAFTLGGFEKACKCFFGKKRDKNYKDPIFRPGYPLGPEEGHGYRFLDLPNTLSQVDLIVPFTQPAKSTPLLKSIEPGKSIESIIDTDSKDPLDEDIRRELWEDDMQSIKSVFDMLRNMKVRRILKLRVQDHFDRSCSDDVIKDCLRGIDIRYLDWKKQDLSADVVLSAAPNVAELWLYSSGRSSVLRGWSASNGICNLYQMTKLHLDAHWGLESYEQYRENLQLFEYELKLNVSGLRSRLFQQSRVEICKEKRLIEMNRIRHDHQELEMIRAKLATLKDRQDNLTAKNPTDEKVHRIEEKIRQWEENEEDCIRDFETAENAKQKLDAEIRTLMEKIGQQDHDKVEREYTQIQLIKSFGNRKFTLERKVEQIPKFFRLKRAGVVCSFTLDPTIRPPPKTDATDEPEISLEDDVREAPIQPHRWLKSVDSFVTNLELLDAAGADGKREDSVIKVALIDDGVDANLEIFKGIIHSKGWPPEEPTSEQYPFYHSSSGHGTAMAKLIKRICPRVQLHVAKLGQWTDKVTEDNLKDVSTAENAAEAVNWAIQQRVHIISMSWSLISVDNNRSHIDLLDRKIQEAASLGIIMYCAAADEALYTSHKELYPAKADTQHIRAVGSAQENGKESAFVNKEQVDYLFPGEAIDELGERKGSSAATALASGLAALILWCFENHEGKGGARSAAHPKKMHHLFSSLKAKDSKWVDATKLFKDGSSIGDVVNFCRTRLETMD
ncbi:hypothetical protein F4802DRAFT_603297 [Xylaria palmicola]|nr:hypothetical protein F4802DRAFT_603297 [Xylaria palmicola]